MLYHKIIYVLSVIFVFEVQGKVTDEEYASMPPLFHLDDFDRCMFLGKSALYCAVTIQLAPIDSKNYSNVWGVIREVISHKKNYRHDQLRHGICVSESCPKLSKNISIFKNDKQRLKKAIGECYTEKYRNLGLNGTVTFMHCEIDESSMSIDIYDVFVGVFLVILFAIVAFASFYEGRARQKTEEEYDKIIKTTFGKIITCFSIPKNWKRLLSVNTSPDSISLRCINGFRFFTMVLVIMVHVCMTLYGSPISNPQFAESVTDNPLLMIVINGGVAIQSFFVMAGWLLSYHFFLTFEGWQKVKFSYIWIAFINRYIRLTPCLLVIISISSTWLYHLGRGPFWHKLVGDEYRNCRKNWWTNLLYINNYYDAQHICLQQSWYLATDMQLFLVSLIIVMFMWKYQKHIKAILGTCLTIAILIPGVINYIYDYDIVVRQYPEPLYKQMLDTPQWHRMYSSGYSNSGGYIIGLMFGYIFYTYREHKIFTKRLYVLAAWILTWGLALSVIFVGIPIYTDGYEYSRLGAAIYAASARNVFALGLGIGIFSISQGLGWFIRDCVVWQPVQVLGRLTYCAYLVHVLFMRVRAGLARSPFYMSIYIFFTQTLGDVILAYTFATILCLFVELPVSALQKLLVPQMEKDRNNLQEKTTPSLEVNANSNMDNKQVSKL